jgi:glycosyltransferase involved in cell wall biosynthesis
MLGKRTVPSDFMARECILVANPVHAEKSQNWVVIAAYNEADGCLDALLKAFKDTSWKVIVVDDGSHDATARIASDHDVTLLQHAENRGQGAAIRTGVNYAQSQRAAIIATFDADGQHRLADLDAMKAGLMADSGVDFILGNRFATPEGRNAIPRIRYIFLKGAAFFTRCISGISVTDAHNGLRVGRASAWADMDLSLDRMAHASEILDEIHRHQMKFTEVPVHINYTEYSKRHGQKWTVSLSIARDILRKKLRQGRS